MKNIQSIKFNFVMNFILTASNFIFPLITFPYVSRVLLASGNGKIAFISSIATYFSMIASLGIPTYGIRKCAAIRDDKDELSKTSQELIFIHAIMTVISLVFFFISIFTVDRFFQEKELMFINGVSLLLNVLGVNWLYSALEKYQYITIRSILFKGISVILMFLLVKDRSDYIIYGAITVFAVAGSNVLNFINLRKCIHLKKYENYNLLQHMKPIMIFFAQSMAITVYTNLDTVMLGFIKNDYEVGLYVAATKVKIILVSLVTSLGAVTLPRLSYYLNNGFKSEFDSLIRKSTNFVLLISLPLATYFVFMAKDCLLFLSGAGFLDATVAMQIIIPSIVFMGLSNITGIQILTPFGKEKYVLFSVISGGAIDLILNAILIPLYGAAGAAIGTLTAEMLVLAIQLFFVKKELREFSLNKKEVKKLIIASLVPLLFVATFMKLIIASIFVELLTTSIIYFFLVFIMCLLLKEETVQNWLRKIKKTNN